MSSVPNSDSQRAAEIRSIREAIGALLVDAETWVAVDAGGYLVRVVSDTFREMPFDQRVELVRSELATVTLLLIECFTREEAKWAGPVFRESAETPPVWSTALGASGPLSTVVFASDLDQDLDPGPVVTFYSLRGGVGRSTALASTARLLAESHQARVLCIDFDLEAPGLAELFGVSDRLAEGKGVVSLLEAIQFDDSEIDVLDHIIPVQGSDSLFVLPAGRLGQDYAVSLANLDVDGWYREERNPLHALISMIRESSLSPDVILIDSRTGLSAVAGPLLFDVSDLAIVFFHPQSQAREGTELLTRAMLSSSTARVASTRLTPEPRFVVSPMPAGPSSAKLEDRARGWVRNWLDPLIEARGPAAALFAEDAVHIVGYSADTAYRDQVGGGDALRPYEPVADWVRQLIPSRNTADEIVSDAVSKDEILRELSFEAGTAETQASLLEDFVVTAQVEQAASTTVPLIVGRKGTGKTALFRWLAEGVGIPSLVVTAANQYSGRPSWSFGADAYAEVERVINAGDADWRRFWLLYVSAAVWADRKSHSEDRLPPLPDELAPIAHDGEVDELELVRRLSSVLTVPQAALLASSWLQKVSGALSVRHLMLFDGLDTAFGNTAVEKRRRSAAISALIGLQAELGGRLPNLSFKIMIRHDIWENLAFENKSHFYGLQLRLRWEDRSDYFKVVLKQAMRAPRFSALVESRLPHISTLAPQRWSSDDVYEVWSLLVGERMKGEQTAFTSNWVWNRLSDGNGDHSPRSLIQLLNVALASERAEHARNPYERSIIRPRLLVPSLAQVSEAALSAVVQEEFPELASVTESLRSHGRTPLQLQELTSEGVDDELIELASDAGLIAVKDDGQGGRVIRVPDLFRHALGVTRPGPA